MYVVHCTITLRYSPMGLWVTFIGGSGHDTTVRSTHIKYSTATSEYVPTIPIFYKKCEREKRRVSHVLIYRNSYLAQSHERILVKQMKSIFYH